MVELLELRSAAKICADPDGWCVDCPQYRRVTEDPDTRCVLDLLECSKKYVTNPKVLKGINCCLCWRTEDMTVPEGLTTHEVAQTCEKCPYFDDDIDDENYVRTCIDGLLRDLSEHLDTEEV